MTRTVAVLALTVLFAVPSASAHAATRAEIEAKIALLKAELAALSGNTSFATDLSLGSTGADVTRLQTFLIAKGYAIPAGATGYFGTQTRSALVLFQKAEGIAPAAGYFGNLTRTKINGMGGTVSVQEEEEATEEEDDSDTSNGTSPASIETEAKTYTVDGADNDYATFRITFDLSAFGADMYIPRNAADALTYRIENAATGAEIATQDAKSATLSSSAEVEGSYYVIREDEREELTIDVSFNPASADEGNSFRVQLLTIGFAESAVSPTGTWSSHEANKYETEAAFIND